MACLRSHYEARSNTWPPQPDTPVAAHAGTEELLAQLKEMGFRHETIVRIWERHLELSRFRGNVEHTSNVDHLSTSTDLFLSLQESFARGGDVLELLEKWSRTSEQRVISECLGL